MDALVPAYKVVQRHFSAPPGKIALLYGERGVYATATLVASEVIRRCGAVVFVDAANRVDPHYLARLARYRSLDPAEVLERAFVSRAFTCYQFDVAITDGLIDMLHSVNAASVIIYGPLDLMDDEQAPLADIYDIFTSPFHNKSIICWSIYIICHLRDIGSFQIIFLDKLHYFIVIFWSDDYRHPFL